MNQSSLLSLLQLVSPALPVGAYSYSEGLESLVETGIVNNQSTLEHWLQRELTYGAVRVEAGVMLRTYQAIAAQDWQAVVTWNRWLSATRETEELRLQSWQMGRSLLKLWLDLPASVSPALPIQELQLQTLQSEGCNFAVAFAIVADHWQIDATSALLGYLHSWVANLVSAGIKLIPLGQTAGQRTLLSLQPTIEEVAAHLSQMPDAALESCGWGLAIASMTHEIQYSRLFRS